MLRTLDLGSSIAEQDALLEAARVETSVFNDLYGDKVDLIPGTKGSGKTALYRIFVDFLPDHLLQHSRVVIAHGVRHQGDDVFHAFTTRFEQLDEDDFVNFWCIYLISLANEQFIKREQYAELLQQCTPEVRRFQDACRKALIPSFERPLGMREVLDWTLTVLAKLTPKLTYKLPDDLGEVELDLFGHVRQHSTSEASDADESLPRFVPEIREALEGVAKKAGVSLWLMIDRLDEIFPRRSELERRALRGLLRTLRVFESSSLRVKVFLRDDIIAEVAQGGFTALTHVTGRASDTLRWGAEQILTLIVNRFFANERLRTFLDINADALAASEAYRKAAFYKVFPLTVHAGER